MEKYHKIQTVFMRDPENRYKTLLDGRWALPEFGYLANNEWIFTEKIDGTNIRVEWDGERVTFGGRTERAQIPAFLITKLMDMFPVDKFSELYPDTPMVLYGEGYGAKIQNGGGNYIPDGVSFIAFDVMISGNYQPAVELEDITGALGVDMVPIVGMGSLNFAIDITRRAGFVSAGIEKTIDAGGYKSEIGTQMAEGMVMRPATELQDRTGRRIIAKIKYKDFQR